ncbi:MAG: PAS domain S-box protein [Syntrophorhabdaceae bacterium]|nr:PAS domain S-box protein [Syntrophorhabdaceae bacterium]
MEMDINEEHLHFTKFMVDYATDTILLLEKNGKILYVNEQASIDSGYTKEELLNMTIFDLNPTLTPDAYMADWEQRRRTKKAVFETVHKHKSGRIYPVEVSSNYINYGGREFRCAIIRDISEKKSMFKILKESSEILNSLINATKESLLLIDRSGKVLIANDTTAERLNTTVDRLIGSTLYDHLPREVAEKRKAHFDYVFSTGQHTSFQDEREGRWYVTYAYPVFDEKKEVSKLAIFAIDITERKKARESLKASEERYRAIFENTAIGIAQFTFEGKFLDVNPALARIYGYSSPEELIHSIHDIGKQLYVRPEERKTVLEYIRKYGRIDNFETERYRKDGSRIWVSVSARAIYDEKGDIMYCLGTVEDISEKKRLEQQLRQAQKMEAIGIFAGGVAHDFNNLLTVITGYAALLQMKMEGEDPLKSYVDQIISASHKASTLTANLLAFSRKQPVSLKPIKLNETVQAAEKFLIRLLPENITLSMKLSSDDPSVMADSTQIDQILLNLAANARDAMPKGGVLSIETDIVEDKMIYHKAGEPAKNGRYAFIKVSDTGIGMDEEIKEHIFDPFFTTKDVGKGTGLGLSTVYGIVRQHNGYITFDSEKGKGTTFYIYLPVIEWGVEDKKPVLEKTVKGKETILIAEDSNEVRLLIQEILKAHGYSVIEAIDGEDAISKFVSNDNIDLIVLDSVMPKKNGREVYDIIVKKNPNIKVLFMSGYTKDIVLDKGIAEGEVNFISKPISPDRFLEKVREILAS